MLVFRILSLSVAPALSSVIKPAVPQPKQACDSAPCHQITPTLVGLSSLTSSTSFSVPISVATAPPVIIMPELAIPAKAYPEQINRPDGGKDYLSHLCLFRHSNLDCILTHVRKHLEIVITCPMCGKGYQNVTSLCKHGRDVHNVQISTTALVSGVIPKAQM